MRKPAFVAWVGLCALLGMACSSPYDAVVPSNLEDEANMKTFKGAIEKLPEEEKKLIAQFMMRLEMSKALGGLFGGEKGKGIPPGTTVRKAIELQKVFLSEQKQKKELAAAEEAKKKAEEAKAKAEQEAKEQLLRDVLSVELKDKGFLERDFHARRYENYITFTLSLHNKSKKDIEGAKGTVEFRDMFDDAIKAVNLSYDDGVPAGQVKEWPGQLDYNQFMAPDKKLAATPMEKLKVTWVPKVILFKDGTRLE